MITDHMVDAALDAYSDNEWRTSASAMRAIIAAVAPLIAEREREACARVADSFDIGRNVYDGNGVTVPSRFGAKLAAAIRARKEL